MKRLDGFTIWELMVIMVISSVTILFASGIFLKFRSRSSAASNRYERILEMSFLDQQIQSDFHDAYLVKYQAEELELSGHDHVITYRFRKDLAVRLEPPDADTFFVSVIRLKITPHDKFSGLVKKLSYSIAIGTLEVPFEFIKEYDRDILLSLDITHENQSERNTGR